MSFRQKKVEKIEKSCTFCKHLCTPPQRLVSHLYFYAHWLATSLIAKISIKYYFIELHAIISTPLFPKLSPKDDIYPLF